MRELCDHAATALAVMARDEVSPSTRGRSIAASRRRSSPTTCTSGIARAEIHRAITRARCPAMRSRGNGPDVSHGSQAGHHLHRRLTGISSGRATEIISRLAADGHRVPVENTKPSQTSATCRAYQRVRNWWRGTKGFRQNGQPLRTRCCCRGRTSGHPADQPHADARSTVDGRHGFFSPLPGRSADAAARSSGGVNPRLTVYYCIDDFASARRAPGGSSRAKSGSGPISSSSRPSGSRAGRTVRDVHLFPFGVSLGASTRCDAAPALCRRIWRADASGDRLCRRTPPVD